MNLSRKAGVMHDRVKSQLNRTNSRLNKVIDCMKSDPIIQKAKIRSQKDDIVYEVVSEDVPSKDYDQKMEGEAAEEETSVPSESKNLPKSRTEVLEGKTAEVNAANAAEEETSVPSETMNLGKSTTKVVEGKDAELVKEDDVLGEGNAANAAENDGVRRPVGKRLRKSSN